MASDEDDIEKLLREELDDDDELTNSNENKRSGGKKKSKKNKIIIYIAVAFVIVLIIGLVIYFGKKYFDEQEKEKDKKEEGYGPRDCNYEDNPRDNIGKECPDDLKKNKCKNGCLMKKSSNVKCPNNINDDNNNKIEYIPVKFTGGSNEGMCQNKNKSTDTVFPIDCNDKTKKDVFITISASNKFCYNKCPTGYIYIEINEQANCIINSEDLQ